MTRPNASFNLNISYTTPPRGPAVAPAAAKWSTNHRMRALDASGVIYARTHSKSSSVGRDGDSNGPSSLPELEAESGAKEAAGGVRRSTGRRLYTGERSAVPPPPICVEEYSNGGHAK